jgi:hypothetical protein
MTHRFFPWCKLAGEVILIIAVATQLILEDRIDAISGTEHRQLILEQRLEAIMNYIGPATYADMRSDPEKIREWYTSCSSDFYRFDKDNSVSEQQHDFIRRIRLWLFFVGSLCLVLGTYGEIREKQKSPNKAVNPSGGSGGI